MMVREVVKRTRIITSVPADGIDLTLDEVTGEKLKAGLHVVGFEVGANAGSVVYETSNPAAKGTLQTIQTPAYTSRPWELTRLGDGTTALPLVVLYGGR